MSGTLLEECILELQPKAKKEEEKEKNKKMLPTTMPPSLRRDKKSKIDLANK